MSGYARTLQKRMLKRLGYHRDKETGFICKPNGDSLGVKRWPLRLPQNSVEGG